MERSEKYTDRDARLASQIGTALDEGRALDSIGHDDLFYRNLLAYRTSLLDTGASEPSDFAASTWQRIEQAAFSDTGRFVRTPVHRIHPSHGYAAAAALALLALLAVLVLVQRSPSPVLVASAAHQIVTYAVEDGSSVTLRPNSELYAIRSTAGHTTFRVEGEGYFKVVSNADRVFQVQADDALITVTGTRFTVKNYTRDVMVFLEEGHVRVEHAASELARELASGEIVIVGRDGSMSESELTTRREQLGWLELELFFTQRLAADIVAELEHHYDISVVIPDDVSEQTLTGSISLVNREEALTDLGLALGGTFDSVDVDRYRFRQD